MPKILVVDGLPEHQKLIERTLSGHTLTICGSAEEAGAHLAKMKFDFIVIEINLPKRDGYSLLTELQADRDHAKTPVICLTSRSAITDKVTAFSLGADDYLLKPFDPLELRARVEARLRKTTRLQRDQMTSIGDIEIDHARHRVMVRSASSTSEVRVTPTEFKLLACLAARPEQVFSRHQLLIAAWGEDAKVHDRVVDVHICSLRKKLGHRSRYIKAVLGVGYKLITP